MALIVTPGSADADSYVTLAQANTFMANVNNTEWGNYVTEQQEAAIRGVTMFFDATLSGRFKGRRTNGRSQAREWPRTGVTDLSGYSVGSNEIPREVQQSILFGVKMVMDQELDLSTSYLSEGGIEELKVGPIQVGFSSYGSSVRSPDPTKVFEPYMRGLLRVTGVTGVVV